MKQKKGINVFKCKFLIILSEEAIIFLVFTEGALLKKN